MIDEDYQPISISVFVGFATIAAFVLIVLCLFVLVVYVWLIWYGSNCSCYSAMISSSNRNTHVLLITVWSHLEKTLNHLDFHCQWYQVSPLIVFTFIQWSTMPFIIYFSMLSNICIYVYIQNRNSLKGAQGQQKAA